MLEPHRGRTGVGATALPPARLKYPYSQRYSEWIREKNLQHLFDFIDNEIFNDGKLEYNNNFYIHRL